MTTAQKQYSPEGLMQMAKTMAFCAEGGWIEPSLREPHTFRAFANPPTGNHVVTGKSFFATGAAAWDICHPGEDPDVVVLPLEMAGALVLSATQYGVTLRREENAQRILGFEDRQAKFAADAKRVELLAADARTVLSGKGMNTQS